MSKRTPSATFQLKTQNSRLKARLNWLAKRYCPECGRPAAGPKDNRCAYALAGEPCKHVKRP